MTKHCSQKKQAKKLNWNVTAEMQWQMVLCSNLYIIVDTCIIQSTLTQNFDIFITFAGNVYGYANLSLQNFGLILKNKMAAIQPYKNHKVVLNLEIFHLASSYLHKRYMVRKASVIVSETVKSFANITTVKTTSEYYLNNFLQFFSWYR